MPRTKFSAGSQKKTAHKILKRPRDDKAKRMYQHMKDAKLENLGACHLWTMFSALKVSAWVRKPSEQEFWSSDHVQSNSKRGPGEIEQ